VSKIKFLFGDALAAAADVGSGLMIGTIVGVINGQYFKQYWPWIYLTAIFFALLPDADFFLQKFMEIVPKKGGRWLNVHHRALLHQPSYFGAIFLVWFAVAILLDWSVIWPTMFISGALLHFLHDSFGEYSPEGEEFNIGVPWLRPFSDTTFVLFGKVGGKSSFLVTKPTGFVGMEHQQWLLTLYLRPNPRLFKELGWFVLWLIVAILTRL
jgi:hypothetical protein